MAPPIEPADATDPQRNWRLWIIINVGFGMLAAVVLLLPGSSDGWRVLALVAMYHATVVWAARRFHEQTLWRAWTILAPLSLLMVLPDWFLSDVLGILNFPDNGGPFIGPVPLAMAGMWTIALMPVVGLGIAAQDRGGRPLGIAAAAIAGLVMFVGAERAAPFIGLWEPVGVAMLGGVAAYVILPELVLSCCAYLLVATADLMPGWATAGLTALLPFTYLGLLATAYQFLG